MAQQTDQYTQILLSRKLGKEVRSYANGYGVIVDPETEGSGIVDSSGAVTFAPAVKNEIIHLLKNRFMLRFKEADSKIKTALIDEKGKQLIPLDIQKLDASWSINERIISSKEGKESVYDFNGKEIIPFSDKIKFAGQNRFFVKKEGGWYIYDANGKPVSDRRFDENLYFYKNRAYISSGGRKGEIIDNNGVVLNTIHDNNIDNIGAYPYLITKNKKGKYGIIDADENRIAEEIYDEVFLGTRYIYLIKSEKVSIFSKEAKEVFPTEFGYVKSLFGNLFTTQKTLKSPKMAVIRVNGEVVIPKEYDNIEGIKISGEDFIYLIKENQQRFLDKDLKNVLKPGYQIERIFPNSLILRKENIYYRYTVTDKSYKELKNVTSIKENGVFYYPKTIFPAMICKNNLGFYGMIGENGEEILPFIYDDIITFLSDNEIVVQKGGKYGVTNYQNEPLKEVIFDKYTTDKQGIKLYKDKTTDYLYFTDSVNEKNSQ